MEKIIKKARFLLQNEQPFVLVSIIAESGSSPRGAGAKMLVQENGEIVGTIGGGAVEYKAMQTATTMFKDKKSLEHTFILTRNQVEDLGMICGGNVVVYFQYIDSNGANKDFFEQVYHYLGQHTHTWLVTDISHIEKPTLSLVIENQQQELQVIAGAVDSFPSDLTETQSCLLETAEQKIYFEPLRYYGRVYLFGGGHVSQALAPILRHLSFSYIVIDDQEAFSNNRLFPDAEQCLVTPFDALPDTLMITPDDYIIIMTRGHAFDFQVLAWALTTTARYIGCIGSKKKVALTHRRLKETYNFSDAELKRIISPIGLSIGADTPEEISISIAAELIQKRSSQWTE